MRWALVLRVSTHGRGISHPARQIFNGYSQHGVDEIRGEVAERLQHERPVGKTRMREFEIRLRQGSVAVEEQVEVEGSRSVACGFPRATLGRFDLQQPVQ